MDLFNIILLFLLCVFSLFIIVKFIIWFYKEYKSIKNSAVQSLMILMFISIAFPFLLFVLDRNNFFGNIGYLKNISSDNWHSFLATYGSSFVSALIGAAFLVVVTGIQMDRSKEDNDDLAKKQLRLQNLPVLKFKINYESNTKTSAAIIIDKKLSDARGLVNVNINIKNIGLGTAQNIKYFVILDTLNVQEVVQDDSIAFHNKDEEITHSIYFNVPAKLYYFKNFLLFVYYEDLLGNKYMQKFDCYINSYSLTGSEKDVNFNCNVTPIGDSKYVLEDHSYRDEKEYLKMKSNEKHSDDEEKIYKLVNDKEKLYSKISEYLEDDVNVLKLISDYFIEDFPIMEGGGTMGNLKLKEDKYIEVIGTYSMGVSKEEFITLTNTLTLDINTLELVSFKLNIEENKLKISSAKLKDLNKYLEKIDSKRNK